MTTITQTEIIERQQAIIDQYQLVLDSHKNARSKMADLLTGIQELLTMNNPTATELALKQLDKLIETIK